ncbi:triose-phosphate isomerase [Sulfurospirillum barnesii]|uniref:Triosephosphate isomerase n=1 Tax=Sulfurospirillum barnesii (strain ATCC 700032 / DSM 10660 / SES-3) TaxID=760154 RepID=I3XV12_SULBS|nr:triose-phosphate isomerase [Sulfurospirillum barnesii]AFL67786.1 triosephosphate isomerase [Sulfurospirillum barnesii SES-3]
MMIASNFKTNYTRATAEVFIKTVQAFLVQTHNEQEVRIFAPFTALNRFDEVKNLKVGVQNFYPVQNGSFTGEIGFEQLEEFGIESVLIGHSERRHILKESHALIAQKYDFAKARDAEIIYCVGEPAEVRMQGIDAVMSYLWEQFEGIDVHYEKLIIAYEPVWAIGTGLSAHLDDIKEVLERLREKLSKPLLYGGSVKVENIESILHVKACDGVLVGTASWNEEAFCEMIRIADSVKK